MANMSTAFGDLLIKARCSENEFYEFQKELSGYLNSGEYGADFEPANDFESNDGCCEVSVGFDGWGRWAFEENLKRFGTWAENSAFDGLAFLKKFDFQLVFEFTDHEPGMQTLYTETASVTHKADAPWAECAFEEIDYEEKDYTYENLVECEVYNEDDIIEIDDADSLIEFLGEDGEELSKEAVESYCSDHSGEIMHDYDIPDIVEEISNY